MAVTITEADLEQPAGQLAASYFPDADLATQLPGWLESAVAKVEADVTIPIASQNDAAAAWVYYLAYSYMADRIAAMPNVASVGSGEASQTYSKDRLDYWLARAAAQKATYDALVPDVPVTVSTPSRSSMSIPTRAVW